MLKIREKCLKGRVFIHFLKSKKEYLQNEISNDVVSDKSK